MSKEKKEKILRVQNLVIHADNVEIIQERDKKHKDHHDHIGHEQHKEHEHSNSRRNVWSSFWGRPGISGNDDKKENE